METRDGQVTTRTFRLEGGTDQMSIAVNPITSSSKAYTLQLKRQLSAAAC